MPEHKDKTFDEAAPETKISMLWDGQKSLHTCMSDKFDRLHSEVNEIKTIVVEIKKQCECRKGNCSKTFVTRKQAYISGAVLLLVSIGAIKFDYGLLMKALSWLKAVL